MHFKTVRLIAICIGSKRIIYASGGLGLLRMVLESDTKRYTSEDVEEIPHWLEKRTKHSL